MEIICLFLFLRNSWCPYCLVGCKRRQCAVCLTNLITPHGFVDLSVRIVFYLLSFDSICNLGHLLLIMNVTLLI